MSRYSLRRTAVAGAALALAGAGLTVAAPAAAAPGIFQYTPGLTETDRVNGVSPEPMQVMSPAAGECIKTPQGANAANYTVSTVELFRDAECKELASRVDPFGMNASPFEAIKAQS